MSARVNSARVSHPLTSHPKPGPKVTTAENAGRHWKFLIEAVRKMRFSNAVTASSQSQPFFLSLPKMRESASDEEKEGEQGSMPVFNKRLFASSGAVVITPEARKLMARNALNPPPGLDVSFFSKSEQQSMRSVVEGLRLIHRGQDHVKDALSHVITFESYAPCQYIVKQADEAHLSCYYILHGAVQVKYDLNVTETRNVYQPDVIYNHGTGEFLGLVSPDGLSDDLSPPSTVYTTEHSELLRIDRKKFHDMVDRIGRLQRQEKLAFLRKPNNPFASLPPEALDKILPHMLKMDFPPNKTVLQQNDPSECIYFILSGRCTLNRDVFIPEIDRDVCFYLDVRERGDFFGEECVRNKGEGSLGHVTTTCHTSCFLMNKSAFQVVSKDLLLHILESRQHYFPSDDQLRDRGYDKSVWNGFKHKQVRMSLSERGCRYILSREEPEKVRSRPPSAEYQRQENFFRFIEKGANYHPVSARVRSARNRTSAPAHSRKLPLRPHTAVGLDSNPRRTPTPPKSAPTLGTETDENKRVENGEGDKKDEENGSGEKDDVTSSVDAAGAVTTSFVRMLEKNIPKGVLQKMFGIRGGEIDARVLSRAMAENPELERQLRLAYEMQQQEQTSGFTKTTVLVTMKTDDIVRKAKAQAEKQHTHLGADDETNELWDSSLHQENRQARTSIAGDKFRAAFLRRKIHVLQRKRAKIRADLVYRSAKPGQVPSGEGEVNVHQALFVSKMRPVNRSSQNLQSTQ